MLDHRVLLVDQRHAAVKVRDDHGPLLLVEVTRQPEARHEVDMRPVERKSLQAVVPAIGDDHHRRRAAGIDPDAVRLVELSGL